MSDKLVPIVKINHYDLRTGRPDHIFSPTPNDMIFHFIERHASLK
jgi:hypothetical protein